MEKPWPLMPSAPSNDLKTRRTLIGRLKNWEDQESWRDEWEKNTVDAAMDRVKRRIKPEHYQIFYLSAVKKVGLQKVAQLLGVSTGRVYLVRHRVGKLIKNEIKRLKQRDNGPIPSERPA